MSPDELVDCAAVTCSEDEAKKGNPLGSVFDCLGEEVDHDGSCELFELSHVQGGTFMIDRRLARNQPLFTPHRSVRA